MKKKTSPSQKRNRTELEQFDRRSVDFRKFKHDLPVKELVRLGLSIDPSLFPSIFGNIETLSPTKTLGRGRTNLTVIRSNVFQVDAAVPRASFDLTTTPTRNPVVQVHFEPAAYGITSVSTYLIAFAVEVFGQGTFRIDGSHGPGGITNAGTRVLAGRTNVTLVFKDLDPSQQIFGFLEQQSGSPWNWFSTKISFPPLVIAS